jgi:hypothetical protein
MLSDLGTPAVDPIVGIDRRIRNSPARPRRWRLSDISFVRSHLGSISGAMSVRSSGTA